MGVREFACEVPGRCCFNCRYSTSRNRRQCQTQACAEAVKAANHAAGVIGEKDDTHRFEIPFVPLGRCSWPSWEASLPSNQHPALPLPALLFLAHCIVPAPTRTFVEGVHIFAAVHCCIRVSMLRCVRYRMRVPTLLLFLRLATYWWYGVWLVG